MLVALFKLAHWTLPTQMLHLPTLQCYNLVLCLLLGRITFFVNLSPVPFDFFSFKTWFLRFLTNYNFTDCYYTVYRFFHRNAYQILNQVSTHSLSSVSYILGSVVHPKMFVLWDCIEYQSAVVLVLVCRLPSSISQLLAIPTMAHFLVPFCSQTFSW